MQVRAGSPADRIEMRAGDVIFSVAGSPLRTVYAVEPLFRELPKGQPVPISVLRESPRGWQKADIEINLD